VLQKALGPLENMGTNSGSVCPAETTVPQDQARTPPGDWAKCLAPMHWRTDLPACWSLKGSRTLPAQRPGRSQRSPEPLP